MKYFTYQVFALVLFGFLNLSSTVLLVSILTPLRGSWQRPLYGD
jgi:hypothetical protein